MDHVLAFGGNSNIMPCGLGAASDAPTTRDADIFQIGAFGAELNQRVPVLPGNAAVNPWAGEPIQFPGMELSPGKGLALDLARYYVATLPDGDTVTLVPGAVGASSILEWCGVRGRATIARELNARIDIALKTPDSELVCYHDHQGETDMLIMAGEYRPNWQPWMRNPDDFFEWKGQFVAAFRARWGEVPMVFGQPPGQFQPAQRKGFVKALSAFSAATTKTAVVAANNLTCNPDNIHYDAASQHVLANRHFVRLQELTV